MNNPIYNTKLKQRARLDNMSHGSKVMMHYILSRKLGKIKTIGTSVHAKTNVKMRPAHLHPGYARIPMRKKVLM